jgi:hypothetical protein
MTYRKDTDDTSALTGGDATPNKGDILKQHVVFPKIINEKI